MAYTVIQEIFTVICYPKIRNLKTHSYIRFGYKIKSHKIYKYRNSGNFRRGAFYEN